MIRTTLIGVFVLFETCSVLAEDWKQFRGNDGLGVADASHPIEWAEDKNVAWKIKVPGIAWSQPIILGSRVYVTTAVAEKQPRPKLGEKGAGFSFFSTEGLARTIGDGGSPPETVYEWKLLCLDLKTGKQIHEHTIRKTRPTFPNHRSNSYASETPATDGKHVFVLIAMTGLYCFDLECMPVWDKPLDALPMQYGWGTGSSPVVHEGSVFLQCDNEKQSFITAFDSETGDQVWSTKRDEVSNWSTPWIWKNSDRTELVTCGGTMIRSYDITNGHKLWEVDGQGRCATTAVGNTDTVFVGSVSRSMGSSADLMAIQAGASGDLSKMATKATTKTNSILWTAKRSAPPLSSPLLYRRHIYTLQQFGGILSCFDAKTGERLYRQRMPSGGGFTSSPWAVGDHIFCLDETGQTFVVKAGPEFKLVETNKLKGMFWSSAAIANDRLLLRSLDHLYCIGDDK